LAATADPLQANPACSEIVMATTITRSQHRSPLRGTVALCMLHVLISAPGAAQAQSTTVNYPVKPIRLVVPLAPGGGTDITARVLAQRLSEIVNQSVIVDNRPGASGVVGTETVARSAPDGYTLLLAANSFVANASLFRKLPYDPIRDFAPVSLLSVTPFALVVHPSLPARTVKELVALAKARPGEINHASSGIGTGPHLGMEVLMQATGMRVVHIAYKGAGAAMNDLIGGQVHVFMAGFLPAIPHVRSGRVRALGVSRLTRSPAAPDIPTIAETGVPGFEEGGQFGIVVPARVPAEIVAKLQQDIVTAMRSPTVMERSRADGAEVIASTAREFGEILEREKQKWARVVRAAGIKPQ
jgi:tripartite-type tricarboxylate transporter receptor subunit TctC